MSSVVQASFPLGRNRPAGRAPTPHGRLGMLQPKQIGNQEAFPVQLAQKPGGQRLPEAIQRKMEKALKADFSDVRIHAGPEAASIGAIAYTRGSSIHFSPGHFNPHSTQGQRLLGHELTHVVQQRAGRVRNPFGSGVAVVQDRALENEANRMGSMAARYVMPPSPASAGVQMKQAPGARTPATIQMMRRPQRSTADYSVKAGKIRKRTHAKKKQLLRLVEMFNGPLGITDAQLLRLRGRSKRKGMSTALTRILTERGGVPSRRDRSHEIAFGRGLKQQSLARNHVLSDKAIRDIFFEASGNVAPGDQGQLNAVSNFIQTLTGGDGAAEGFQAFQSALTSDTPRDKERWINIAIDSCAYAPGNLRIDNAELNSLIGEAFDPELTSHGMTARSRAIRDAVFVLARAGVIKTSTAFDTTAVSVNTQGGQISSSMTDISQGIRVGDDTSPYLTTLPVRDPNRPFEDSDL